MASGATAMASAVWWWWRPRRVVVRGGSMTPTLQAGDHLLVVRSRRARPGEIVALVDPREPERVLVKRVAQVGPSGLAVLGDNAAASTDSRHFGPVPASSLLGRVRYRYAPADRVGRLGSAHEASQSRR